MGDAPYPPSELLPEAAVLDPAIMKNKGRPLFNKPNLQMHSLWVSIVWVGALESHCVHS